MLEPDSLLFTHRVKLWLFEYFPLVARNDDFLENSKSKFVPIGWVKPMC